MDVADANLGPAQPAAALTGPTTSNRYSNPYRFRAKRVQVARACDECRSRRVKCDNKKPCSNCEAKGRHCSNADPSKPSNLQQACAEIERLRRRVHELEAKLQEIHRKESQSNDDLITPPTSSPSSCGRSESIDFDPSYPPAGKVWEGILIQPIRSNHKSWFGPSSLYHFIHRLSAYLSSNLQQIQPPASLLPDPVAGGKLLQNLSISSSDNGNSSCPNEDETATKVAYLNSMQEEYFINFFWQTYHTSILPIVDEEQFKKHYQSLWTTPGGIRKPSALVDTIMAICMQYGISTLPSSKQGDLLEDIDATMAGRRYYRRAQALLAHEMESPSISTLQCHILSVSYLCGGSFHNMVEISTGVALRTAYMLGLHLEPDDDMPERDKEIRRRLWWAVYVIDSKIGMKLGRPFLALGSNVSTRLPSDSISTAALSGSSFAPIGNDTTWLSFNLYQTKLYSLVRAAHTAFYGKSVPLTEGKTIWDSHTSLEAYAELLLPYVKHLDDWVKDLPVSLKTNRQNNGSPLSTDQSVLEIEQFAPVWLQRQRILLELTYHHLCVNLYRPFLSFGSTPLPSVQAEAFTLRCVAHAITFSRITRQVLSETAILDGWHETFHWQWNAAVTLVGFVLVYPHSSWKDTARSVIDAALWVFDTFGTNFTVAANAAKILRELLVKVDFLTRTVQRQDVAAPLQGSLEAVTPTDSTQQTLLRQGSAVEPETSVIPEFFDMTDVSNMDFLDMAVSVDFWADIDMLWQGTDDMT